MTRKERSRAHAAERARFEAEVQRQWAWYTQVRSRTLADAAEFFRLPLNTLAGRFHRRGLMTYGPQQLPRVCRHCGYRHPSNTDCMECGHQPETAPQQEMAA